MRRFLAALLAVGAALPAYAEDVVVWHAWRESEEAALQQAADAWTAKTGDTVSLVAIPFGAFSSKLETAIPRGNGPDLFIAAHDNLGKWTAMDLITPLQGSVEGQRPATVDAVTWDGTRWGLPLAYKSVLLLYDPTRIAKPPATTDELLAVAREYTRDGGFGLAYQAAEPYFHAGWMHGFGGAAYGADGKVHLDSADQEAAYAFVQELTGPDGVVPAQPTAELMTRLYNDGLTPMVISGPWFLGGVERPIAAAPLPIVSATGLPARPYLGVDAVFMANGAKHPTPATSFAAFLAGPEGAELRQNVGRQAVSWAALRSDDPLLVALAEQAKTAVPMPADPDIANVFEAQARSLRRLTRGASTPALSASSAQTYYTILSKPPPPATSPVPYVVLMVIALLGLLGWNVQPLLDPNERARVWAHRWDYLWIAPAGVAMALLVVVPFLTGATVAFFAHHGGEWTFVGFRNFTDILFSRDWPITSPMSFWYTLVVTLLWTVTNLTLHVSIGVALALLLREPWVRLTGVWRALLIVPWAVPNYITALIWKGMFHAQYGAINALLGLAAGSDGPAKIDWFGSFTTSFLANLSTNTWLGFPFMMVVTLGALQSIPRELEEAAKVDGAGYFFRLRHIIWPLLRPALMPAIILGSVWTFNMFNVIYLVSAGEPDGSTEILISEAYRWAFSRGNRYGYAAAYAVLIFGVLLMYSRTANRLAGKKVL